jgi:ABC-2 type transport system ATP-binding protein
MNLHIEHLSKSYTPGVRALDGVSLDVGPGLFGLLGPNGAGKSTLMRTLATLQDPDEGSVRFGGLDLLRQKHEVRALLGYLPQEFGVYPRVSAEDMLDHFARLKGIAERRARRDAVDALLRRTNLYEVRKRPLGTFSGGMRQRFGIAQALLGSPKLVIVDEPTAGLDPEERVRFHNLLADIGRDVVVLLSTHIVADVSDLCASMAVINRGRVLLSGDPASAIAALSGKVWEKTLDRGDLASHEARFRVLSTRLVAGRTRLRALSEGGAPDASFEPASPELEDAYFAAIKGYGAPS